MRNEAADRAHGYERGVPLRSIVWDAETAFDREMARLDALDACPECCAPDGHCDHTTRYVAVEPGMADGR